ncbi:MAG: hypothetical protein MK226_07355 [Saprospiraceae bacterium]|jgi:hypothetical protein|nr:hypothetical protein [Saprospiraceae bacterium]
MKTKNVLFLFALLFSVSIFAQDAKTKIAVSYLDVKGLTLDPSQAGNLARKELAKTEKFNVLDQYDMEFLLEKEKINLNDCFGRLCLVEAGKIMKVDKFLTGSLELYEEQIVVTLRLIDVGNSEIEQMEVMEFLDLRQQLPSMLRLTIEKMFEIPSDEALVTKLTEAYDYNNAINNPKQDRLELNGPRMGFTYMTGEVGSIFQAEKAVGGFEVMPLMFQFGYQFEVQYLNQGDFQALFEFIPVITGLDQGLFIPSISVLNGLRSNKTGWEFAFGPIFYGSRLASGYYDASGAWKLEEDWVSQDPNQADRPTFEKRLDSRGNINLVSSFVFGLGKTLKSGNLNIPINLFFIPNKEGHRFGISVGFNTSSFKKKK